jgi:LAS superfamily LD-carboxypeptidase LdcB
MININKIILEETIRYRLFEQDEITKLKKQRADLESQRKDLLSKGDARGATALKNKITELDKKIAKLEAQNKIVKTKQTTTTTDDNSSETISSYPVPEPKDYTGNNGNLSSAQLKNPVQDNSIQLTPAAADAFDRLMTAIKDDIGKSPERVSGYRDYKTQFNLVDWNNWKETGKFRTKNGDVVAKPGTSNHGLGLAIDVDYPGNTPVAKWIREKGVDYGWVWSSEDGGEGEASKEPWHFVYNAEKDKWIDGGSIFDIILDYAPDSPFEWAAAGLVVYMIVRKARGKTMLPSLAKSWERAAALFKEETRIALNKEILNSAKTPGGLTSLYQRLRSEAGVGMQNDLKKMINRLQREGHITADEAKIQIRWIESNGPLIAKHTERKVFKAAHDMYKKGQLTIDELMQIYPAEMRNSPALRNTLMKQPITVAPADFTAAQLAKFKRSTNPLDKPLRKYNVLKPLEKKAIPENEIIPGLTKLSKTKTPSNIKPLDTLKRGNKSVLNTESIWNRQVENFLKRETKIPEKWLTDFPKDVKQFRKEWEEFTGKPTFGTGKGETGLSGDKKMMSKYYYYSKLFTP